jgi:hypothetical protein
MRVFIAAAALLLAGAVIGAASAAPTTKNPNIGEIPVDCGGGIGGTVVLSVEQSAAVFLPDGQVAVGKRFEGDVAFTITTFNGTVFGPFFDSFEEGAKGKGFQSRLVECSFSETFTDAFTLDAGAAEFFGIPAAYVGTEVTFEGTVDGTAWVIIPGN